MRHVPRELEAQVRHAARNFPAVVLTGPRRSGKTWLLRHLLPRASYVLVEDPEVVARVRADPQGLLDALAPPVILDELQNAPGLFAHVRARIDRAPRRTGLWYLTASQDAPLMQGVTESMAARAAVLQLLPFCRREHPGVDLLRGGFPEVLARPRAAALWFSSYVQTYLERDVRSIVAVRDLATFRRFLALVASRHGTVLNKSDLAAPLGVSVPTIGHWLGVLEMTAQILLVPPFYENLGKRLIKSPKIYLADPGLACHLLGVETARDLERSPFLGPLLEGFVAAEIVKAQTNRGRRRELYYFRDQQGLEVDFVVPGRGGSLALLEVKAARSVSPRDAAPLLRVAAALRRAATARPVRALVVHRRSATPERFDSVAPGVAARTVDDFLQDPLGENDD
jgi:predicted AAA+ superfamily ATPase